MSGQKHQALCNLARIKSDRALQALSGEMAARAKILSSMEEVRAAQQEAYVYAAQDITYGAKLGTVEAYAKATLAQLNAQLTTLDARIATLKAEAAREFGRVTVLEKLLKEGR
jgi:uncharacterized protein YlxW (UPF0749 family)